MWPRPPSCNRATHRRATPPSQNAFHFHSGWGWKLINKSLVKREQARFIRCIVLAYLLYFLTVRSSRKEYPPQKGHAVLVTAINAIVYSWLIGVGSINWRAPPVFRQLILNTKKERVARFTMTPFHGVCSNVTEFIDAFSIYANVLNGFVDVNAYT